MRRIVRSLRQLTDQFSDQDQARTNAADALELLMERRHEREDAENYLRARDRSRGVRRHTV